MGCVVHGLSSTLADRGTAESLGLAGVVSGSVANSAKDSSRWYALLVGVPILLVATRSLLQSLIVAHRLAWTDVRTAARKPTAAATVQCLIALACFLAVSTSTATVRHSSLIAGTTALLVLVVPYSAMWLVVSLRLPRRDAPWRSLLPGALVLGIGLDAMQAATTYLMSPSAESKQGERMGLRGSPRRCCSRSSSSAASSSPRRW